MKISMRVLLINLAFVAVIIGLVGLSSYQLYTMKKVFTDSKRITTALRDQLTAGMMHDGLRADVLYAMKLARDHDYSKREDVVSDVAKRTETFKAQIAQVENMNLSADVNNALQGLKDPLEKYTSVAARLVEEIFINTDKASVEYEEFQKDFRYLEKAMDEFSTVIENEFETVNKEILYKETIIFYIMIGATLVAFCIAFVGWLVSHRKIVDPINRITHVMEDLAGGNLDVDVPFTENKDAIGDMANAVDVFLKNEKQAVKLRKDKELLDQEKLAYSELLQNMAEKFDSNMTEFLKRMYSSTQALQNTSDMLVNLSDMGKDKSVELENASVAASQNVSSVASASEEMMASIKEINAQISRASDISANAVVEARDAGSAINELAMASDKIGEVVTLIQDIAAQTNLLALNATIEAARAGDAGKGFAVVASEVKTLAEQTAKATDEIAMQISSIQRETKRSVDVIESVGNVINQVNEIAGAIASAMEEQSTVIQEVVQNTQFASEKTNMVGGIASTVSDSAQETQKASFNVSEAANDFAKRADDLKGEVETFLASIKAKA